MLRVLTVSMCLFAVSSGPSNADRKLDAKELIEVLVGQCILYVGPTDGRECFFEDGTLSYDDDVEGSGVGTWEVRDNYFCVLYEDEPVDCGFIFALENGRYSDGIYSWCMAGPNENPAETC